MKTQKKAPILPPLASAHLKRGGPESVSPAKVSKSQGQKSPSESSEQPLKKRTLETDPKEAMRRAVSRLNSLPHYKAMKDTFRAEVCQEKSIFFNKLAIEEYKHLTRQSPMLMCAEFDDPDCVRALVSNGVPVDDAVEGGNTALFAAIGARSFKVARYLLDQGASMESHNYGNLTPREIAQLLPNLPDEIARYNVDEVEIKKLAESLTTNRLVEGHGIDVQKEHP